MENKKDGVYREACNQYTTGEKKQNGIEAIYEEVIAKKFPKMIKDIKPQDQRL